MEKLLDKISAYDFLNMLIPGSIVLLFLQKAIYPELAETHIFLSFTFAYVLGVLASRIGSLALEPIALKLGWFKHDYESYVKALDHDEGLSTLSTVANMYRSLTGSALLIGLLRLGQLAPSEYQPALFVIYGISVFLLLFCGWIKQERYIQKRLALLRKDLNGNR